MVLGTKPALSKDPDQTEEKVHFCWVVLFHIIWGFPFY